MCSLDDNISNRVDAYLFSHFSGYKPALYVSGKVAVDLIFTFPVALLTVQFTTTTSRPTQV